MRLRLSFSKLHAINYGPSAARALMTIKKSPLIEGYMNTPTATA